MTKKNSSALMSRTQGGGNVAKSEVPGKNALKIVFDSKWKDLYNP